MAWTRSTEAYTFLYLRRSSEEDDRQALSLDAQQRACEEYAERNRLRIHEVIRESHSARRAGRPLFNEMLARTEQLVASGQRVRLLSHKTDRLLRNYPDWAKLNDLWERGIELEFVNGSFPNNAQGRMVMGINVVMAKHYVDNLSEEVRKGLNEKLERGEWPGWAPLGYRNVRERRATQRIEIDPVAGPLVRRAFEAFATGEYSLAALTERMEREGLVGRLRGRRITKSVLLDRVLTNPFYYGALRYRGTVHRGTHPPLVSRDTFEQVQAVLTGRSRPRRQRHEFRFSGVLLCGRCGCAVVGDRKKGRYTYYRCSHRRGACTEQYLREERLTEALRLRLDERITVPKSVARELQIAAVQLKEAESTPEAVRSGLSARIRDLEQRRSGLMDLRLGGLITEEEFITKRAELAEALDRAHGELSAFELPATDPVAAVEWFLRTCNDVTSALDECDARQTRQLLRLVGSNYRLRGGEVDFEPVKPFDLASQVRNRPTWRQGQDEVHTVIYEIDRVYSSENSEKEKSPKGVSRGR